LLRTIQKNSLEQNLVAVKDATGRSERMRFTMTRKAVLESNGSVKKQIRLTKKQPAAKRMTEIKRIIAEKLN
jgi:hypothetical protein